MFISVDMTLLYLFIFLFRELSPFPFFCACPGHPISVVTSVTSCPWESYIMVFATYCHTGVNVPECSGPEVVVLTVCTHAPSSVYTLTQLFCLSLWLQRCTHWCPLRHVARACFWLSAECGWLPLSSCWTFLFQIGLWWKGRLLIARKQSNRRLITPCPFVPANRETLLDSQSS